MDVAANVSVGLSADASVDVSVDVSVDKPVGVAFFLIIFFVLHTSRVLTGSSFAVPSRGPRGIPSLVVAITLDCRSTVIAGEIAVD